MSDDLHERPRWLRDLTRFLPLKSQFVLSGNIKDWQLYDHGNNQIGWYSLKEQLALELSGLGYKHIVYFNPARGFDIPFFQGSVSEKQEILQRIASISDVNQANFNIDNFTQTLERLVSYKDAPVAIISDFASQYSISPDHLSKPEHNAFTRALVNSQNATLQPHGEDGKGFYNSVIWIVDKEGDLPDWFVIGNPKLRHIPISKPNPVARRAMADSLLSGLKGFDQQSRPAIINRFVDETEGLLLIDLEAITTLARSESLGADEISDAVRRYKIGVTEDPWQKINREKIRNGDAFIQTRVKGQNHAVTHSLDIIKRAITGVGNTRRGGRPRGVIFLAGPTGVGKTELAKTITSLLFGDERAYIRFDMSEFSAEHADQRLIGAPPGYVGYDVGGELTNAVREKPFSVVLFDEIEKAHPRILDKFLQVLDDGVLTSGRGDQVYFSETFIIFTSNLGIYKTSVDGVREPNVSPSEKYPEVSRKVKAEIERYFKLEINRPELLNRIGENIIVFDFIRDEIAHTIYEMILDGHISSVNEQMDISLQISESAKEELRKICTADLGNGGRGIRNQLEFHFINPLSRVLFDLEPISRETYLIKSVERQDSRTNLKLIKISER
ncbi:AAA family ATPase [Teredinibacter turnerae]|uniref:AAA family ATPase n=1 Tax=Teredinibacter turnerae TaxID=2426 RepID=UPI0003FD2704|nr:AAA family ATPase [Teredinibacter turnerae]